MSQAPDFQPRNIASHALEAYENGKTREALRLFREYLEHVPDDPHAHLMLGDCLACTGDLQAALAAYSRSADFAADPQAIAEHAVKAVAANLASGDEAADLSDTRIAAICMQAFPASLNPTVERVAVSLVQDWRRWQETSPVRFAHYEKLLVPALEQELDLLFVIPPFLDFTAGYPPHGVGVLGEYLRQKGFRTQIADLNLLLWETADETRKGWWASAATAGWTHPFNYLMGPGTFLHADLEALAKLLGASRARYLGFSCFYVTRPAVLDIVPRIKRYATGQAIILGGADCFYPRQCRNRYGDIWQHVAAFVAGEGESPTAALLAPHDGSPIPGVIFPAQSGQAFQPPQFLPQEDLNHFPKFDPSYIDRIPEPRKRLIGTNRGCVNRCDYCYDRKAWGRFRLRDPKAVVEEIRHNIDTHGIRRFHLTDSATNSSTAHLEALCGELIRADLGVKIFTSLMVSSRMTQQHYRLMRQAGITKAYFGIESGSTAVLKAMRKSGDAQEAARNLRMAHEAGIDTSIFIIVGHPSETEAEFQETLDFLLSNKAVISEIAMVNPCIILEETDLEQSMECQGICLPEGWDSSSSWSLGANTPVERIERRERLIAFALEHGIAVAGHEAAENAPEATPSMGERVRIRLRHWIDQIITTS